MLSAISNSTSSLHIMASSQANLQQQRDPLSGSNSDQGIRTKKNQTTVDPNVAFIDKENTLNDTTTRSRISRPAVLTSSHDAKRPVFGSTLLPMTKNNTLLPKIVTKTIPETPQPFQLQRTPIAIAATSSIAERTPYSILSLELSRHHSPPSDKDDDNEMLLFSPVPPATKPTRKRPQPTRLSSPPERVPIHQHPSAPIAEVEDTDSQIAVFQTKSIIDWKSCSSKKGTSPTASAMTLPKPKGTLLPKPEKQDHIESKPSVSYIRPPKQKPSSLAVPMDTPVVRQVAVDATPSSTISRAFTAIKTKRMSGSVCLDLTNMFMEAAPSTTAKRSVQTNVARHIETTAVHYKEGPERPEAEHMSNDDDPWAEKQVDMFTKWLNFLFYPSEDRSSSTTHTSRAALRSLALHQQMAQGRRKAKALFYSAEFQNIRDALCLEIGRQRIALRKDRDLYSNLDDRGNILSLLLSYSTPWLRLGLETMFHTNIQPDIVALRSPKALTTLTATKRPVPLSRLKLCLKNFIIQHVLSDDQILLKYTGGKCKVPSGQFEERYRAELRTIVVYRLLVLILFLDRAKTSRVLDDDAPNLFVPTSTAKSTRAVLLTFCRNFLQSEGDFTKHLARLGISVHYQQEAMDELDFSVTNLRVDLNDGVRLTRMTELLTGCPSAQLISLLRLPAVSRLQKFYNVQLAMDHLQQAGVPLSNSVAPHHIVDGHREMVLKLLWSVVGHCCLHDLLSVEQVQKEIERIHKLHRVPLNSTLALSTESALPPLLLQWCNAICQLFGHPVNDWSYSFADGKAACLLIHYYHPSLLQLKELRRTSRDPMAKYCHADVLLANERAHGMLANACISDLGGIPEVIPICDTLNPPDEKTMLFAVSFLCSRLIESSIEVRACLIIQQGYRRYRFRVLRVYQVAATVKILRTWRRNRGNFYANRQRRYGAAVRVIEDFITERWTTLQILQLRRTQNEHVNLLAVRIQKHVRSLLARRTVSSLIAQKQYIIFLQSKWRQALARRLSRRLVQLDRASRLIQMTWRTFQLRDARKHHAAIQIQRMFRGYWHRVQFVIDKLDIIAVQSCVRRYLVQREYSRMKFTWIKQTLMAALLIQSICRRWLAQRLFQCIHSQQRRRYDLAAVAIQTQFRRYTARRLFSLMKHGVRERFSATKIQSLWRMFQCRLALVRLKVARINKAAAIVIQSAFRRYQSQWVLSKFREYATVSRAAVVIQAMWRAYCIRIRWVALNFAATCIQAMVRRTIVLRYVCRVEFNVTIIQSAWRTFLARSYARFRLIAIRRIQANGRMLLAKAERYRRENVILRLQCGVRKYLAGRQLRHLKQRHLSRDVAAIVLQRHVRGFLTSGKFQLVKQDAVVIQTMYRRCRAAHSYHQKKTAIICLQSHVRRFLAQTYRRNLYAEMIQKEQQIATAIIFLQAMFRGFAVRKEQEKQRCSVVAIQSLIRGNFARQHFTQAKWIIVQAQSLIRRWLACRRKGRRRLALLRIQSTARMFFARCHRLSLIARKYCAALEHHSALTIQRVFRGMKGRQMCVKESAARMIQKTWRCYTVHVEYMLSILAAMDIQAVIRRYLAIAAYEYKYAAVVCIQSFLRLALAKIQLRREETCAIVIQSCFRMISKRSVFVTKRTENTSVILIQTSFRRYMTRCSFLYWKTEAILLQRCVRGYLTRLHVGIMNIAATEIQRIWLGFVSREFLAWKLLAVIRLQSFFRSVSARDLVNQTRKEQYAVQHLRSCCSSKIQRAFRAFLYHKKLVAAVSIIERTVRLFLSRKTFGKVRRGVVRVQCLARGHIVRSHRTKKLNHIANRIAAATQKALSNPSMKLSCRTQSSLDVLRTSKSLSEIMTAVCVLEMATRLSQTCCEAFAQAGAPDILFSLIHTCNRSLPHIALLQYILLTLTNVARFDPLVFSMATVKGVEIFFDLVQMFRDKELVFCLVAKLLERVVRSNEEVLVQFVSRENLKRLKGVRDLCVRKLSVTADSANASQIAAQPRRSLDIHRRCSFDGGAAVVLRNGKFDHACPDVRQGVRSLQRIIRRMERDSH